jgi:hypothetical protein
MSLLDTNVDRRVDLTDAGLRALTARTIGTNADTPFGVYIFAAHDEGADLGRHVEQQVFAEAFGNSAELLEREYGAYEHATAFLVVVDHRRQVPAGMMRLILPSDAGFKTLDEIEAVWEQPLDDVLLHSALTLPRDRVWDIATLAVAPDYRGKTTAGLVSLALYRGLCRGAMTCGVDWWVTILDTVVLRMLQWQLSKPFTSFHGIAPMGYLGSNASMPAWADVKGWRHRLAEADVSMFELLFEASEFDAAVSGPDPSSFERFVPSGTIGTTGRGPLPEPV